MSKLRQIIIVLLVGLLLSGWTAPSTSLAPTQVNSLGSNPEATDTVRLIFQNKTGAVIEQLVLNGPKVYTFYDVPMGKSEYYILKGKYTIQYKACGVNKSKKVTIQSNYKFSSVGCPLAKLTVINDTGGILYLNLKGPVNYRHVIPPGTTRINIIKGTYEFTGSTNCGSNSGTINAKGRMRWNWWCT